MRLLQEKRSFPKFPVDLSTKDGQRKCKEAAYEVMGELFESIAELRHAKSHRVTDLSNEFDRKNFVTELIDAQHFLFEVAILAGVTEDEFYETYVAKDDVNTQRINSNY